MADWLNHVTIAGPRNATTTHTVTPSSGTVAAGTLFTPTAGRFLLCFPYGGVTSTLPTGWTQPTNGSAVNAGGLYAWYRTAAGADSIATTHNASNYPVVFDFYEFAAGTTFVGCVSATNVSASGGAGPSLASLTGTNWTAGVVGQDNSTGTAGVTTWSGGTKQVDTSTAINTTDGYTYSLTATDANTAASASYAATIAQTSSLGVERLVFAVNLPAVAAPALPIIVQPPRR